MLEAEAPGVDERRNGDVEGAVGLMMNGLGQLVDLLVHGALADLLAAIMAGNGRRVVEHGELAVDLLECGLNLGLQVVLALIGDVVDGAEDEAVVMLIGHGALLADDEDGADNEQQEEQELIPFHISMMKLNVPPSSDESQMP